MKERTDMKPIRMTKPRSLLMVTMEPDPADNHFVNITVARRKTGQVAASHYILRSDLQQWVGMYERDGFVSCEGE